MLWRMQLPQFSGRVCEPCPEVQSTDGPSTTAGCIVGTETTDLFGLNENMTTTSQTVPALRLNASNNFYCISHTFRHRLTFSNSCLGQRSSRTCFESFFTHNGH